MAFGNINYPGAQPISESSTVQKHPLGTCVKGVDPDKGEAEFVYAKGVASTVVGSLCELNGDYTTAIAGVASKGPVGVAMSVNDAATKFGWYCIRGRVSTVSSAGAAGPAYLAASGAVTSTATALQGINGARIQAAQSGGFSDVVLFYPSAAGYAAS